MGDPQDEDGHGGTGSSPDRTVGNYRILRSLGRGGFGEVFLGETPDGARAAVKVLHASWAGDADMRRRFTAEVEQARRVSGFCIAAILDADPDADEPWIATEYIDGPTLQDAVAGNGPRGGVALHRLAISTATALAAIHAAGVVHRDLKPDNIMLAPDGPRVIDFGIARAVETTSVTASGVVGTIGYMAPEQLEGARLTSAVDLFAWGSVMVYAATGQEAFAAPTQASRIARILGGQPELGVLTGALRDIVQSCLDKDPEQRPDASTLLNRLISAPADGSSVVRTTVDAEDTEHTTVTPPPDERTRVGVERTRVAGDAPAGVAPTRVAPPAKVDPTRSYTRFAPDPAVGSPAPNSSAPGTQSAASMPVSGAPHIETPPPHSGVVGGVPPYHFAGIRFTDPRSLAAAMQQNWSAAVRVFSDTTERAALGAWVIDDLRDTTVDRSLFRRQVTDANMAIASFVAQLYPDLPPIFRGRGATVAELGDLFADPRPIFTGAPQSNEMALLARSDVLRVMGAHQGERPGALRQLADHLDEAEREGMAFHDLLTTELAGWRTASANVNPALILTFLLHPERMIPPGNGGDKGVAEWLDILWARVEGAGLPANAGYAAAVYGALPTLQALSRQRRYWEERFAEVAGEHDVLMEKVQKQEHLTTARKYCQYAIFLLPAGLVVSLVTDSTVFGDILAWLGFLGAAGALSLSLVLRVVYGEAGKRRHRIIALRNSNSQLPQLTSGVERIRGDLAHARRISGA